MARGCRRSRWGGHRPGRGPRRGVWSRAIKSYLLGEQEHTNAMVAAVIDSSVLSRRHPQACTCGSSLMVRIASSAAIMPLRR